MLEIKEKRRKLVNSNKLAILSTKKVNDLINRMCIALNPNIVNFLRRIADLTESVFDYSYFIETFKGETIKIANYNIFNRTIKFAREFFKNGSRKYLIEITEVSEEEVILEIFCKKISILKIRFSSFLPIEFDFLTNNISYDEIIKYYQYKMNEILKENSKSTKIKKIQQKLANIINVGEDELIYIERLFEGYIQDFSINMEEKSTWYIIKTHTLKDF